MTTETNPRPSAPVAPESSARISGHAMQEALASTEREVIVAKSALQDAEKQFKRTRKISWYYGVRLWAARTGAPAWLAALSTGSVLAIALSVILIFALDAGFAVLCMALLIAYAGFGGGVLWLFRNENGENDGNRVENRSAQLAQAEEQRRLASEIVRVRAAAANSARDRVTSIKQALQSEGNKRQAETDRLLNIEAGRLYPDEFERYVAEIFSHLGYTIEVTGQSGDQGVDVVAAKGTQRLAIQAKRYIGSVGNSAVQEVYAGMAHRKCHRCLVVTNSEFTTGAIALAESTGCLLIGSDKIPPLIRGEIAL